jgi:cyclic pyranopterin phosphate synthase
VAQVAGIMGAKRTSDVIPMCHPLLLTGVDIAFAEHPQPNAEGQSAITVTATVKVHGQTGVEMEALTAVSIALLTIYDMCKAIDKGMTFGQVGLLKKTGGKSGTFIAPSRGERAHAAR